MDFLEKTRENEKCFPYQWITDYLPPKVAHQAQIPVEVFHGEESKDVPQDLTGQAADVALGFLAGRGPKKPIVRVRNRIRTNVLHLLAGFSRLHREPRHTVLCLLPAFPGLSARQGQMMPWGLPRNPIPLTGPCGLIPLVLGGPRPLPWRAWPYCSITSLRQGAVAFCSKNHLVLRVLRAVLAHRIAFGHVIGALLLASEEEFRVVSQASSTWRENPNKVNEKWIMTDDPLLTQIRQTNFQLSILIEERDKDVFYWSTDYINRLIQKIFISGSIIQSDTHLERDRDQSLDGVRTTVHLAIGQG